MPAICSKPFSLTINSALQLVAYWKMDEASGDRSDSKGTNTLRAGNFAGPVGGAGPGSEAGVISNAVVFTAAETIGGTAGLTLASPSSELIFDPTKGVTWGFWYRRKTTGPSSSGNHIMQFGGGIYLSPNGLYIDVEQIIGFANNMTVFASSSHGFQTINLGSIAIDVFHLIIVWIDPADYKLRVQVDNGSVNVSPSSIGTPTAFPTCYVFLGKGTAPNTRDFDVDEMAIWKGLLDSTQRDYIWNSGAGHTIGPGYPGN